MLQTIPISAQTNTAFLKNPKGIHESERGVDDFPSAFAAATAVRRDSDSVLQGVSSGKNSGKVACKEECELSKDQDSEVQSESPESERSDKEVRDLKEETVVATPLPSEAGLPEAEKSDELLQDHEEGTFATALLLTEEDLQKTTAPNLLMGQLNNERVVQNTPFSESLKSEIDPNGNPRAPLNFNSQNPIIDKENNVRVTSPLTEGKQDLNILNSRTDTENKVVPNFGKLSVKLPVNEVEPWSEGVKSTPKFHGEKDVNGKSIEVSHAAVKTSKLAAIGGTAKEKKALNPSRNPDASWTRPLRKSQAFSIEPKISDKADRLNMSEKAILSSKRSSSSTIETAKITNAVARGENEKAIISRRGRKSNIMQGGDGTDLKQKVKINTVTGNTMNAGDSGAISKKNISHPDLRTAMESIPGEPKIVGKGDQNQKDSSLKPNGSFGRIVNVQETEAPPSKTGSDNRKGRGDAEKQNRFQGKDFHGTLEKLVVTKGEDAPIISKARYGSNSGVNPVTGITETEIQKSPGGKENMGSLVRTTMFLMKNGRQEARMALHPESLGQLKIRILTENQQVTVRVMAETVAAKEMLEHNLHQLKADFQNQGLEVSKFDVSLSQDSDRNGTGQNPAFASNRTKDKSGSKKEENPRQSEKTEQTASDTKKARHNDAVDFFA